MERKVLLTNLRNLSQLEEKKKTYLAMYDDNLGIDEEIALIKTNLKQATEDREFTYAADLKT
jgi:hypothetical protein